MSCTSCINAAEIPQQMMKKKKKKYEKGLYIVDTPGFEDTRGTEIDVANQIGTINALYGCNSIRIVIILPIAAGLIQVERCVGSRDMATIINQLCPDFQRVEDSMRILINKNQKNSP